jgi:sulfur carrier protein
LLFITPTEYLICIKCGAYDDGSMDNMRLEINGESREISPISNVRELLQLLGIVEGRVAVEVNRKIIRRADWESTPISSLDKVEIVQFVGGG